MRHLGLLSFLLVAPACSDGEQGPGRDPRPSAPAAAQSTGSPGDSDELSTSYGIAAPGSLSVSIPLGQKAEALLVLREGQRAIGDYKASAEILWDSHIHPTATTTEIFESGRGRSGRVELVAPRGGIYGFLFTHAGASAEPTAVEIHVSGEMVNLAWMEPEGDTPWPFAEDE
jgi:hypothetical protein